ncbi:MAG TPA: Nif3-like dinuclear metal center hexameric protein, partial [Chthoniobacterales bacterium]|nr:Nif3-like dinuclear metal center hexameric protein [Chthoniobacterales bacterium]
MLNTICNFLDDFLKIKEIEDYPNAFNGLQLENDGRVKKIGAAVDASEATIQLAIGENVDLLIVHHGLFWGGLSAITGAYYRKLRRSIVANLAVYSAHLPLDLHPELGNNILLAKALGLPEAESLFCNSKHSGVSVSTELDFRELLERLREVLSRDPWVCASG